MSSSAVSEREAPSSPATRSTSPRGSSSRPLLARSWSASGPSAPHGAPSSSTARGRSRRRAGRTDSSAAGSRAPSPHAAARAWAAQATFRRSRGRVRSCFRDLSPCGARARAALVTLMGDAGVGKTASWAKSGLACRRAAGAAPPERAADIVRAGNTYWPLGEMLKQHFGIQEDTPPETVRRRSATASVSDDARARAGGRSTRSRRGTACTRRGSSFSVSWSPTGRRSCSSRICTGPRSLLDLIDRLVARRAGAAARSRSRRARSCSTAGPPGAVAGPQCGDALARAPVAGGGRPMLEELVAGAIPAPCP